MGGRAVDVALRELASECCVGRAGVDDGRDRLCYFEGDEVGSTAGRAWAQRFRGRRVAFTDGGLELMFVPDQRATYGFDVREHDLGPQGPILISRVSREVSELHGRVLSFAVSPVACVTEGEHEDLTRRVVTR